MSHRNRNCLPLASTWVHSVLCEVRAAHFFFYFTVLFLCPMFPLRFSLTFVYVTIGIDTMRNNNDHNSTCTCISIIEVQIKLNSNTFQTNRLCLLWNIYQNIIRFQFNGDSNYWIDPWNLVVYIFVDWCFNHKRFWLDFLKLTCICIYKIL